MRKNIKYFKVIKYMQGISTTYYAEMPESKRMKWGGWHKQLETWGETTNGGYNYGYRIKATRVKKIPPKCRRLYFYEQNLTK